MRNIKWPKIGLQCTKAKVKQGVSNLSAASFRLVFEKIDQLGIKKGVDQLGLDSFVNQCALLAASSGVLTGAGGFATMAVGVPLDLINIITQQFRVALAVSYSKTGSCEIRFDEFFRLAATSIKGDAGVALTKTAMEDVAKQLMVNLSTRTAQRLVPVVGAVIGGSANYLYIKSVAASLKNVN